MNSSVAEYRHILAQEAKLLGRFVELLEQEQKALVDGANEALPDLAAQKTQMSEQLISHEQDRARVQSQAGIGADKGKIAVWLTATSPEAAGEWESFLELVARAKALNELNGRLITERLNNNQQAIHALMAAANRTATYGPKGQSLTGNFSRSLGSA